MGCSQQGAGAVAGAAPEEAAGGEGGTGPGEHGSVGGAEPSSDDGASADEKKNNRRRSLLFPHWRNLHITATIQWNRMEIILIKKKERKKVKKVFLD